jgi:hypothetical protein
VVRGEKKKQSQELDVATESLNNCDEGEEVIQMMQRLRLMRHLKPERL